MNVLIIGASRGIGLELVRQYRANGAAKIAVGNVFPGSAGIGCFPNATTYRTEIVGQRIPNYTTRSSRTSASKWTNISA